MQRAVTAVFTAASRFAEGITTKGSEPPSSSTVFLSAAPARAASARPASSLPVRVTARIASWSTRASARAEGRRRVVKAPAGNPALAKTSSIASAHPGTLEACFRTMTLPAISAGMAARNACQSGKFQGMTASTAPSGS